MVAITRKTKVIFDVPPGQIPYQALMDADEPVILKGVARDWPMVQAGLKSPQEAMTYLKGFANDKKVVSYTGDPEIGGRFFYNADITAFNFESEMVELEQFLERVAGHLQDSQPPSLYIGSTTLDSYLPGFRDENDLALNDPMFDEFPPLASIWLGNRTVASAHYDLSNNMACCLVGKRRFTLFPPEQIHNLYPGPLEPTPGGQVVSMVDFDSPDLERFPRFSEALEAGQVAEMEPGDLLFYPSMWWHQVEALDDFNVMVNYWWNTSPGYVDTPMNTLLHGLLSIRDRPEHEKRAWRALFDYYVFGNPELPRTHIPEHAQGNLAPIDERSARRLRAQLISKLNR